MKIKITETKPQTIIPSGSHYAICYSIIDLGTQIESYHGQAKKNRKIRLTWEFPDFQHVFKPELGEQPLVCSREYTLSLAEKSNLRRDVESWLGQEFKTNEIFDIQSLLGRHCLALVSHNTSTNGNVYANIRAVMAIPKDMEKKRKKNPIQYLSLDSFNESVFESLPEFIKNKIIKSPEYTSIRRNIQEEEIF